MGKAGTVVQSVKLPMAGGTWSAARFAAACGRSGGVREALLAPVVDPALPDAVRSSSVADPCKRKTKRKTKSSAPHGAELHPPRAAAERAAVHGRQQSVPHSGVREALLAPVAVPALPDAVRSSSVADPCKRKTKRKSSAPHGAELHPPRAAAERAAVRVPQSACRSPRLPSVLRPHWARTRMKSLGLASWSAGTVTVISSTGLPLLVLVVVGVKGDQPPRVVEYS